MESIYDIYWPKVGKKVLWRSLIVNAHPREVINEYEKTHFKVEIIREILAACANQITESRNILEFVKNIPKDTVREKLQYVYEYDSLYYVSTIYKNNRFKDNFVNYEFKFSNDGFYYKDMKNYDAIVNRKRKGDYLWRKIGKEGIQFFKNELEKYITLFGYYLKCICVNN